MGNTTTPPIYRFVSWLRHRQSLCAVCHSNPKVTLADGDDRYCSEACQHEDYVQQANAF